MLHRVRNVFSHILLQSKTTAPVSGPGIDLFYWRPASGEQNFGDHLSQAIVTKIASDAGLFLDEKVSRSSRLLAIGSILHFAGTGDVIWGSGVNGKIPENRHLYADLDVRAVRGPLTADFLRKRGFIAPDVFGDPALLTASLLGNRFSSVEKTRPYSIVPNFAEISLVEGRENVVSPLQPWVTVISQIVSSELVISSSLHGLVIADSFNIPCIYVRLSEIEGLFKYEDYVLGAGRNQLTITNSIEEALRASPMSPAAPDLTRLKASFPYDLWN